MLFPFTIEIAENKSPSNPPTHEIDESCHEWRKTAAKKIPKKERKKSYREGEDVSDKNSFKSAISIREW